MESVRDKVEGNSQEDADYEQPRKKQRRRRRPNAEEVAEALMARASEWNCALTDLTFSKRMDTEDPLAYLREMFHYPKSLDLPSADPDLIGGDTEDSVYLCGNSLGLLPKQASVYIQRELEKWAKVGVHGHFIGEMPWALCDEGLLKQSARLIGAKNEEVVVMNGLTVNQHLMLISFYNPTPTRHKILLESKAFPSDHYVIQSQIQLKGYNPVESMLFLEPRPGEHSMRLEDIVKVIEDEGDHIAVIMLPGVQYYTGQLFDMAAITKAGHAKDCYVGFDLAHAVGNVELRMHDWRVDFAVWCSYKYLNSGAGGIAGAFLHERNFSKDLPQLNGWWSHKYETRFRMDNKLDKSVGASSYRISNPSVLMCASLEASLEIFSKTNMKELCTKSRLLTGYLEILLKHYFPKPAETMATGRPYVEIITPADPAQRGCQLSVLFSLPIREVFLQLEKRGVVCDMREPNVLRLAPVPLYNSFTDVHRFVKILGQAFQSVQCHLES